MVSHGRQFDSDTSPLRSRAILKRIALFFELNFELNRRENDPAVTVGGNRLMIVVMIIIRRLPRCPQCCDTRRRVVPDIGSLGVNCGVAAPVPN